MSMIEFSCPSCKAHYKVPQKAAGKQATCKSCNGTMTVPKSSSASSSGGSGGRDLSGLYAGQAAEGPAVPMGSVFAPSAPKRGGPNPMLLAGIGGGVLVLILVVVLVVVLMGGKGDKPADPVVNAGGGPATIDRGGSRPSGNNPRVDPGTNEGTDNGNDSEGNGEGTPAATQGRPIDTPTAAMAGVMDWTLPVPDEVAFFTDELPFRGIILNLPPDWETKTQDLATLVGGDNALKSTLTQAFGNEVLQTAFLEAGPRESSVEIRFGMIVARRNGHGAWPQLAEVDRVVRTLPLNADEAGQVRDAAEDGSLLGGMLSGFAEAGADAPLAFNMFGGETFYLHRDAYDRAEFGTLMGGHPFARVELENKKNQTRVLLYTGYVADLQVIFIAETPTAYDSLNGDMDWIVRTARLMDPQEAADYAQSDSVYGDWINDRFVDVAYTGDGVPHAGLTTAQWAGFDERSLFQGSEAAASTVTPYRQPYGIVPPKGMRLASVNRLTARWFPDANGMWLQLRVTKLEGHAQRNMDSPILSADGEVPERLFVYSTEVALPAGYEAGQVEADDFTLHRILLPARPDSNLRKVYYVLFDGGSQVTIEGHFDKSRPEDLEQLDAAAQSLIKI